MLGKTHIAGGMAAGALIGAQIGYVEAGIIIGGISALMPDLDHSKSMLGREIPVISIPLQLIFGHRSVLHTIWFCLIISISIFPLWHYLLANNINPSALSFIPPGWAVGVFVLAGSISHIILDSLTKSGVHPILPFPLHLRGPLTTGDPLSEYPIAAILLVITFKTSGLL